MGVRSVFLYRCGIKFQISTLKSQPSNLKSQISNSHLGEAKPQTSNLQPQTPPDLGTKVQSLLSYAELKERNKVIKKAEKAVEQAEQKIEELEQKIAAIETKLATPEGASDTTLFTQYGELKTQLLAAEDEWTEASEKLEELKN